MPYYILLQPLTPNFAVMNRVFGDVSEVWHKDVYSVDLA